MWLAVDEDGGLTWFCYSYRSVREGESVKCEMWIVRERLRNKEKDGWSPVDARVKNKHVFFCIYSTPQLNRFGSVGVFPVSGFWNRNRTEPKNFSKILIVFFYDSVFLVIFSRFNRFLGFFFSPLVFNIVVTFIIII